MGKINTIGFTGTSRKVTPAQRIMLELLLARLHKQHHFSCVRHGDCVGADALFDAVVRINLPQVSINIHPGHDPKTGLAKGRARCNARQGTDVLHWPRAFMARNQDIVDLSDVLICIPDSNAEVNRRGEWATVRRARKAKKPVFIIWPTGTVAMYEPQHQNLLAEVFEDTLPKDYK